MTRLLKNLFDFEREETAGEILFYRLFELVLALWVMEYAWRWGEYILRIEDVVLPLGIARYVDVSFMYAHGLSLANAAVISALAVVGYFRLWRYAYLIALLLLHLQYVARFSLGKIPHGSNFIGTALLCVAAATVVFEHRQHIRRTALGLCYFFFGLGYTTAAFSKLVGTGPDWVDGRHLWMWIGERTVDTFSSSGVIEVNALQTLALDHYPLATAILVAGLAAELSASLMWFKRTRPFIMTLLIGMHFGILWVMKISFSSNVYLLILLAYPWAALIDRGLERLGAAKRDQVRRLSTRLA